MHTHIPTNIIFSSSSLWIETSLSIDSFVEGGGGVIHIAPIGSHADIVTVTIVTVYYTIDHEDLEYSVYMCVYDKWNLLGWLTHWGQGSLVPA